MNRYRHPAIGEGLRGLLATGPPSHAATKPVCRVGRAAGRAFVLPPGLLTALDG